MTASTNLGRDAIGGLGVDDRVSRFDDPLERLLYMRVESQLLSLPGHELSLLAKHSEERYFEAGSRLMREGGAAPAVHFLVEGRVTMRRGGVIYKDISAPGMVGMIPVLSQDPAGVEAVAEDDAVTLEIAADIMLDIVEDNFRFMAGALRATSSQMLTCQRELEVAGLFQRSEPEEVPYPDAALDLVQRLGMMRRGIYAQVNLEPLLELIASAEEIRLEPGTVLWEVGDTSDFSVHVVYGVIACEEPDGARNFRMGPGSLVGVLEANANQPRSYKAVTETRLVAIRSRADSFYDVLEDHTELGMGLLGFLTAELIRLQVRLAKSKLEDSTSSDEKAEKQ